MIDNLTTALEITVVGMALVFGAIILLWLVMLALVRLTADSVETSIPAAEDERELKRRAALAAVAVALARERSDEQPQPFPLPPTAIVTAWQAVQRGRLLSQKGPRR
jgi:Na+-transporting methylmalonyl-CoA/oxaloacetate decarboxylase gamma subunit